MKQRLRKIIDCVADGKITVFAETLGWSTQYINNMLNTKAGIGLKPILTILEKYPEINARWLLLGEGSMFADTTASIREYMYQLLRLEQNASNMTAEELRRATTEVKISLARLQWYFDAMSNPAFEQIVENDNIKLPEIRNRKVRQAGKKAKK